MITVVISVYKVANFPDGGGHLWVYMQYALGLARLGCEVYWLEQVRLAGDRAQDERLLATFHERMSRFGLAGRTLLYTLEQQRLGASGDIEFIGCTWPHAAAVLRRADVLLNFHYAIDPRLLACARRTALVDIDPGLLQFWVSTGQLDVPHHDRYLTTGETVGTPRARFSDCGLAWSHIRPPVCLDLWPFTYTPRAAAFTTVSSWLTTDWLKVTENGTTVLRENTKRVSFLEFVELPRHTRQVLELALHLDDNDAADRATLERHGWHVRRAQDVAASPDAYRCYVQQSRGEFSCAKPSCMDLQNAWISDRTLCYLASGKPVVVQHTGPSEYVPSGDGLFRFTSLFDAAAALERINADYERHCRAARQIAETYFDSRLVLEGVLNAALA